MRTFLALDLPGAMLDAAADTAAELKPSLPTAKWVHRDAMHVTLRFLGKTSAPQVDALRELVRQLGERPPPRSTLGRVGAFPEPRRARVLFLELVQTTPADGLVALAAQAELAAVALGFDAEHRPFKPHLTLARLRAPRDVRPWLAARVVAAEGPAAAVTLYESKTLPDGPAYTPIARARFESATGS